MALTGKQRVFIDEYLICLNATQAAIRAGYSEKSAAVIGHENLKKPNIAKEISTRLNARAMTADETIARLADHARGDLSDFVDIAGRFAILNLEKAESAGKLHLIKKLKYNTLGAPEIELYDAQSALQLMGRYHKLFTDKTEVTGKDGNDLTIQFTWRDMPEDDDS